MISGKTFERPGLTVFLKYARTGNTLAVTRLDRLGRSLKELLGTVEDQHNRGIGLISLEERIDTTSAAGELVFHVFGAIAHFEPPEHRAGNSAVPHSKLKPSWHCKIALGQA